MCVLIIYLISQKAFALNVSWRGKSVRRRAPSSCFKILSALSLNSDNLNVNSLGELWTLWSYFNIPLQLIFPPQPFLNKNNRQGVCNGIKCGKNWATGTGSRVAGDSYCWFFLSKTEFKTTISDQSSPIRLFYCVWRHKFKWPIFLLPRTHLQIPP